LGAGLRRVASGGKWPKAGDTYVGDVALPKVFFCLGEDDIHTALEIMRAQQVRRLPVVNHKGALQGILSLDDIVLLAGEKATDELTYADVVDTMKAIIEHPRVATSVLCANDAVLSTASLTH